MSDHHRDRVTFGIKTTPMRATYEEISRVWQEADALPAIADAWLWDHLLPVAGPRNGQILEGWTLLSALAAQTRRLRLGLLVTSNRIREPAVLGKIATTVDVISQGRLIMGLGVGGTHQPPDAGGVAGENPAIAEYDAYGLTLVPPAEGIARLAETITILKNMWTEDVFDFHGRYYTLKTNQNEPKPVQRPGPPLLIGGWGTKTLRLVAEQADIWNIPGPRTTPSTTSPNAAASWTPTALPSAGTGRRSHAPCSTSSPTTIRPVTGRRSWISSTPV